MKRKKLRNNWKRRVVSFGAVTVMLSSITASAAGEHDGRLTDRAEHTDKNFEDYEYERMDVADFDAIIDGLADLTADPQNADQVLDVIIGMEDYYCQASRCYSIAHIHSDLVADDQYWDDEVMFWDELTTDIGDKIMTSYNVIATSPNADVLKERVDDEDEWQDILDYQVMTQEQKDLSAKETELSLQYDILYNKEYSTTVDGKSYTEEELEEVYDQGTIDRDAYMTGYADILTQKNEDRADLYLQMVDVRTKIARSYGYENFAEYAYDKRYGRDYTSAELKDYRDAVKDSIVPLQDELIMELYGTHYNDLTEMFEQEMSEQDCLDNLRKYLPEISSDMLPALDYMEEHHLYDISISDVKAPGGYTISITDYNAPFLYNCADGSIQDMETLIHEYGHYNQMYHMTADSWYYDKTDLDLAEIHSQGLELLFMDFADELYGDYAEVMKLYTLFNLTYATVEGCKEDAFQYAVYSDPDNLTAEKLNQIYYDCCTEYTDRFGAMFDETMAMAQQGYLPNNISYGWDSIPHTFQSPMYYISYSVSAAAVFELFDVILDDRDEGIESYLALVDAEFQQGFQDTLDTVGLNNPIQNPRFDLYADDIRYELGLVDERTVVNEYDPHHPTTYWGGSGELPEKETDDEKPQDDTKPAADTDAEDDDAEVGKEQAPSDEATNRMMVAGIVAAGMFAVALIIVIVVIVKMKKEKKAQQGVALNRNVNAPNPYLNRPNTPGMGAANQQVNPNNVQNLTPQQPISPYAGQTASTVANVTQPINPYMNQQTPVQGTQTGADPLAGTSSSISSANIMDASAQPVNPYTQQSQINPYAGQNLQINPYAQQQPVNPYLQNLQTMQTQTQQEQTAQAAATQAQVQAAQSATQAQVQATQAFGTAEPTNPDDMSREEDNLPVPEEELRDLAGRIPADRKEVLIQMIRNGQKLDAIKECREMTGTGLLQAKTLIEAYEKFLQ